MAYAAVAAIEVDIQKCLSIYCSALYRVFQKEDDHNHISANTGVETSNNNGHIITLIDQILALSSSHKTCLFPNDQLLTTALAAALFGEFVLRNCIVLSPKQHDIHKMYPDFDVHITESAKHDTDNDLINDGLKLLRTPIPKHGEESNEPISAIGWMRKLANCSSLHLPERSLQHAIDDGVLRLEDRVTLHFFHSKRYPVDSNLEHHLIKTMRMFALQGMKPQSKRESVLVALWYALDLHSRHALFHDTVDVCKVFPSASELKQARKHLDAVFRFHGGEGKA